MDRRFDPRGRVNRALLVGVSEYDHTKPAESDGVPGDLPAVRHNLERLEAVLRRGGLFGEDGITVCHSPSLDEFSEELRTAAHRAEGLLLCYFAGHGAVPSAGDELFLQMRNARVVAGGRAVFPGADAFSAVLTVLAGSRAERIVVILDCCYAGNAAKVWHDFTDGRQKILLLMSVQANRLIDSGDGTRATPFTEELVQLLDSGGELSLLELFEQVRGAMAEAGRVTTLEDPWEPQFAGEPGMDVLLGTAREEEPAQPSGQSRTGSGKEDAASGGSGPKGGGGPRPRRPPRIPGLGGGLLWGRAGAVVRWFGGLRGRVRGAVSTLLVLALAGLGLGGYELIGPGGDRSCAPPLELRLLTDPELEPTVRAAADRYFVSDANTTEDGCRRTGITVYSAGVSSVVTALRRHTDAWQDPSTEDDNPQRDIGPQPDVWIPASATEAVRVIADQAARSLVVLEPATEPLAYSPVVLAVPQDLAGEALGERVGRPLSRLIEDLRRRDPGARVLRPDPEFTDSALLATVGLYSGAADPRTAEQSVRPTGRLSPTAAELLCTLPSDRAADARTAVLVPEFLLRSGVGCARSTRVPRTAAYPGDVPALTPTFVRVRWQDGDRDAAERDAAVERFRTWLTGAEGRAVFGAAGFRHATEFGHPLLDDEHVGTGVLRLPRPLPGPAERTSVESALEQYRRARGPGRVLYLLDSSSSMDQEGARGWDGPGGGPGILTQSLGGLGTQDEYGVWAVYDTLGGRPYEVLLPFGQHRRAEAAQVVEAGAAVRDAEADPHAALLAALDDMAGRGADDERPRLIVYITDDEDNNRLTGRNLDEVLARARQAGVPVVMVSLVAGSCDRGRPDARIAEASGGRCLDAGEDLGRGLYDEVARVGMKEE
ncbi:substrate-binding domain-containing protein [Streptomyces sp. LB8]|uniref:Peptidase C14 caspase domain-containing protein n=1 Tax=Streptomyces thermogriseus TaxID=75292 RepID=A0ABN1T1Y4_9ACTN|nr:substrate-binding domain-containing protein [Streptomyces sp. LB8]MDN5384094.1 substrate-binding domain-containing protein [Streptomyces sp. LB8]